MSMLLQGRVFTQHNPEPSNLDHLRTIDLESCDRRSAYTSQADQISSVLCPTKMLSPDLLMGMKQSNLLSCQGILCSSTSSFITIAARTRQT